MQIIPFKDTGSWSMQISLSGTIYNMNFKWNALNQFWLMDILDANFNPIAYGIVVVPNFNLTEQFAALTGMPTGDIVCQNILNEWGPIQRFDMGQTTELIYYEPGEYNLYEPDADEVI
jgi:hypothetical protein